MGDDLGHRLQARLLTLLLRGLSATWRLRETIPPECAPVLDGSERGVVAFWHGKMLPVWYRFRGPRSGALVSMSRDGALLADYLERGLRYGTVIRGSSSRSGGEALREMVTLLGERTCLITPDGPRGPLHRAKPGALIAALRAGVPVVLAGWECSRVTVLRSWDRMEIPHPFARIDIRYCIFDGVGNDGRKHKDDGREHEVVGRDIGEDAGQTLAPLTSDADGQRDEPSQFDPVGGDTFAGSRSAWIGPDVLERFDHALDALNAPHGSTAGTRSDAASSRGSRRT